MSLKRKVFVVKGRSIKRIRKISSLLLTIDESHPVYWLKEKNKTTFLFF